MVQLDYKDQVGFENVYDASLEQTINRVEFEQIIKRLNQAYSQPVRALPLTICPLVLAGASVWMLTTGMIGLVLGISFIVLSLMVGICVVVIIADRIRNLATDKLEKEVKLLNRQYENRLKFKLLEVNGPILGKIDAEQFQNNNPSLLIQPLRQAAPTSQVLMPNIDSNIELSHDSSQKIDDPSWTVVSPEEIKPNVLASSQNLKVLTT